MIAYKWTRKVGDNEYRSQFIRDDVPNVGFEKGKELTYQLGKITEAPASSDGIYCYSTYAKAINFRRCGQRTFTKEQYDLNVLLKVKVVAKMVSCHIAFMPHYMAVQPICEVIQMDKAGKLMKIQKEKVQ